MLSDCFLLVWVIRGMCCGIFAAGFWNFDRILMGFSWDMYMLSHEILCDHGMTQQENHVYCGHHSIRGNVAMGENLFARTSDIPFVKGSLDV